MGMRIIGWGQNMGRERKKNVKRGFDVSPTELKTFLLKYHSNPTLWFRGQLIKYIWRENELTLNATNQSVSRIPFECVLLQARLLVFMFGEQIRYLKQNFSILRNIWFELYSFIPNLKLGFSRHASLDIIFWKKYVISIQIRALHY
uniref:Alpha-(1,6)-fucosyltransferase N- and catalytic domain-containing protein n=1 Tax=Meloidogyne enterolobii TaxID=390850 RepID=A0A6V7UJ32_MELEN|nr:unnamed protein product [Meloidogyne enterolobii]